MFQRLLDALSTAALSIDAPALILAGYPPPVDEHISWMTVTADPAVIEINMAPVPRTADLLRDLRQLDSVTVAEGLASYRLQYNGEESDSGGGGQITLGGPRAESSPFLTKPHLLPGLVRYFNRHPSLSYLHAFESVGPASQAPRVDESGARHAVGTSRWRSNFFNELTIRRPKSFGAHSHRFSPTHRAIPTAPRSISRSYGIPFLVHVDGRDWSSSAHCGWGPRQKRPRHWQPCCVPLPRCLRSIPVMIR